MQGKTKGDIGSQNRGIISLGRWTGVPVAVERSWFLIFALVWFALGAGFYPENFPFVPGGWLWAIALGTTLLFFATILGHEFAHAWVARRRGVPVRRITLNVLGGLAEIEREPPRPADELLISAAGPLASLGFAGLFSVLQRGLEAPTLSGGVGADPSDVGAILAASAGYLATINLWLALFNSIPGFPLDGGRVLRAVAWRLTGSFLTATRFAVTVGRLLALLLIGYGAIRILGGAIADAPFILVGLYLQTTAQRSLRQVHVQHALRNLAVGRLMHTDFAWTPAGLPLLGAWQHYFAGHTQPGLMVIAEGRFAGLVTHGDLRRVPAAAWATTPVSAAMTPVVALLTVAPHDTAERLLALLQARAVHQVPVLQDGCLVGLVTRADLVGVMRNAF